MKGKHSRHLVDIPRASSNPTSDPDYYNEHGDPIYAHMVSTQDNISNKHKHLIQFLISTKLEDVRNSVERSSKCPTVLLMADTGADMNLLNSKTFDTLFNGNRTILQPSSLRMELYRNIAVEVLGKFHVFLMEGLCIQTVVLHYQCQ